MTGRPAPQQASPGARQPQQASPGARQPQQSKTGPAPQPAPARSVVTGRTISSQQPQSSTPRLLRIARAAAAAAALLTGLVATGSFSTDGVSATPNVVVADWVAAERAVVLVAEAEQLGAARVAGGDAEETRAAFDAAVTSAGRDLGSLGEDAADPGEAWAGFLVGAERAVAAPGDGSDAAEDYLDAAAQADAVRADVGQTAQRRIDDLGVGSASVLTTTVGTASTLVLVAAMAVLALRTRRIVNVPLLVATLITAGLTYVSANPGALPLDYDTQVEQTTATATALQEAHDARAAQYAESLGASSDWQAEAEQAGDALAALGEASLDRQWETIMGAGADTAGLEESQAAFEEVTTTLQEQLDAQLSDVSSGVGAPALITAAGALLLGVVASGLAWTGITRRLRDYR